MAEHHNSLRSAQTSMANYPEAYDDELRRAAIFDAMSNTHRHAILAQATVLELGAGQIWQKDDTSQDFCLLVSGRLRMQQETSDGLRHIARYVLSGDVFEMPHDLDAEPQIAAVACADSTVLIWSNPVWTSLLAQDVLLSSNTARALTHILRETQTRVRQIATQDVEQRLANAVLGLLDRASQPVKGGLAIDFPIGRKDFADMIGTTQTTVSRIVSTWETKGFLRTAKFKFEVTNIAQLRAYAAGLDRNSPARFANQRKQARLALA